MNKNEFFITLKYYCVLAIMTASVQSVKEMKSKEEEVKPPITIKEWIVLTDNRISEADIVIQPCYLKQLDTEEISGWVIKSDLASDYQDWFPFMTHCNGIRWGCLYININKKSKSFEKIYRLTQHMCGDVEFDLETNETMLSDCKKIKEL